MHALRVTVCELPDDRTAFERAWRQLVGHVTAEQSDLLVLPEMPFAPWLAISPEFDRDAWEKAVLDHETWSARFPELAPAAVISSRPVTRNGVRLNEGFAWSSGDGYRRVHDKRFLPDEEGYWEARWYDPGEGTFDVCEVAGARAGMLICTEMWSFGHAQAYGRAGAQLVLTPRATGRPTVDKWLTGGRAAAIAAGAFSLSSNWAADDGGGDFGGAGWVIDPDGRVLSRTSPDRPFATTTIDLELADRARRTYPRYALS